MFHSLIKFQKLSNGEPTHAKPEAGEYNLNVLNKILGYILKKNEVGKNLNRPHNSF